MGNAIWSVLVANRGEIARRVIRAARARGIRVIAVCSRADATAPFVREADTTVLLPGDSLAETYLNIEALIAAARSAGADAVHPGYGFLAENADFAAAVAAAGLTYLGPSADTVALMGSKVAAKEAARAADVPVLPDAVISADVAEADLVTAAEAMGYPMLVKASAGGGGRGMRLVVDRSELAASVGAARSEAQSAFGDGTVFLERYLSSARHVEVQVIADRHGTVHVLGDRECSVQRRHQKLIEEAPAVCIPLAVRELIGDASARLTSKIGYEGVGTCEFLVEGSSDNADAFFLEMNTRLQVEHTVTEEVTGLDLVDLQFAVALGERVELTPDQLVPDGVAVQARLCAEDAASGWIPSTGTLWRYRHPDAAWIRHEHGVVEGDVVTPAYDSMIAKVVATGPTRPIALARLVDALERAQVAGVVTNRHALAAVLRHPDYVEGTFDTAFLDKHPNVTASPTPTIAELAAAAVTLLAEEESVVGTLPLAWRWGVQPPLALEFVVDGESLPVRLTPTGERVWTVELCGTTSLVGAHHPAGGVTGAPAGRHPMEVEVLDVGERLLLRVGAEIAEWTVARRGPASDITADEVVVSGNGRAISLGVAPRFRTGRHDAAATGPVSSLPGTVVEVRVAEGDTVTTGTVLAVVEAMKMQHPITAPYDAVVARVLVAPGQAVEAHQLLLELTEVES